MLSIFDPKDNSKIYVYEICNVGLKKGEAHQKDFQRILTFPLFIEMDIALSYILYLQFSFIDSSYFISIFSKGKRTE